MIMQSDIVIEDDKKIIHAIEKIEKNRKQILFVVDSQQKVLGVITNGDLRRYLLGGGNMDASVTMCMNKKFHSVTESSKPEKILKLLDIGFHVIPRLDKAGRIIEVITPELDLATPENKILTRARAPVRISFGGGGSDLTYYFQSRPGAVLNTTVALFSHATLIPRSDGKMNIHSEDLDAHFSYESLEDLTEAQDGGLLRASVSVVKPRFGFDLHVRSDFPLGSGLGGSSAVTTAVVSAFNEMRLDRWTAYKVAELAFQAERLCFGVAGGWQDQYASAFGGFNFIEFHSDRNLVQPIRLDKEILDELEQCLVLCNTHVQHDSGRLHEQQRESFSSDKRNARLVDEMVSLSHEMHENLMRGELVQFGRNLGVGWNNKQKLSESISNHELDGIYAAAISEGALGGKLMGAGGGGFFLFFVLPQHRMAVTKALRSRGCDISSLKFETEGVVSWRTKFEDGT